MDNLLVLKTAIALEEIKSGKGNYYCKKGDRVTIYQMKHDTVYLCQFKDNKFPCDPKKLKLVN